jgi:methylenetetrahydrofolate reductase (NADPH)
MRTSYSVAVTPESAAVAPVDSRDVSVPQLVAGFSIEATPKQLACTEGLGRTLPAGTGVYVPFLPRAKPADTAAACRLLSAQGLRPVPHVAARAIASRRQLDAHLRELADNGVDSLLLIAGDRDRAAGPFASTLAVFDSGVLERYGFRNIGVAGHPEGHPAADGEALVAALRRKAEYADETGSAMWVVTQFAFSAEPLIAWLERLRSAGVQLPVRPGIPGPAKVQTLLRYAAQCGIGASARMLARRPDTLTRLLGRWTPYDMLAALARHAGNGDDEIAGVHIFPFGGLMQSVEYFNALRNDAGQR